MDAKADAKKKLGYVLFTVGIILIAYVIGSIMFVFVGAGNVPFEIFKTENGGQISFSMPTIDGNNSNMSMENTMEDMYPMFNLMVWLSIAFLLLLAGYFLCKLGLTAMTPPALSSKSSLRRAFGGKKYNTNYGERIERGNYCPIDEEEFERRPRDPI